MSEADKMFEELGYIYYKGYDNVVARYSKSNECKTTNIYFFRDKSFSKIGTFLVEAITIPELEAINAKVKELDWEWLDEYRRNSRLNRKRN